MAEVNGTIEMATTVDPFARMNSSSGAYNISNMVPDKMDRENYLVGRNQFECALRVNQFMKYVNGIEVCPQHKLPDGSANPNCAKWLTKDDIVLGWIKATVAK